MSFQHPGWPGPVWPPHEASFRQPFLREPKSLAIVPERPDRGRPAAPKQKQAARKRIGSEFLAAQLDQSVDTLPSVDRLQSDQNAHVRRDLQHRLTTQKHAHQIRQFGRFQGGQLQSERAR